MADLRSETDYLRMRNRAWFRAEAAQREVENLESKLALVREYVEALPPELASLRIRLRRILDGD